MALSLLLSQSSYRLGTALAAAVFAQEIPAPDTAHLSSWLVDAAALGAIDGEILDALRRQGEELATLRNRCTELTEAQADTELDGFADVITNRTAVRAQLLANREGTLAVLHALRRPEPFTPLHDPRAHRPNLHLLSPLHAAEAESGSARRIANRARQLQSQLKIGHQAAFRLAEGEDAA